MTEDEFKQYWKPARDLFTWWIGTPSKLTDSYLRSKAMAKLLGFSYDAPAIWKTIDLTPELKQQLQMLAGPHHKAVIKIIEIQREHRCRVNQLQEDQSSQSTASSAS